jgi:hypothetical protein
VVLAAQEWEVELAASRSTDQTDPQCVRGKPQRGDLCGSADEGCEARPKGLPAGDDGPGGGLAQASLESKVQALEEGAAGLKARLQEAATTVSKLTEQNQRLARELPAKLQVKEALRGSEGGLQPCGMQRAARRAPGISNPRVGKRLEEAKLVACVG